MKDKLWAVWLPKDKTVQAYRRTGNNVSRSVKRFPSATCSLTCKIFCYATWHNFQCLATSTLHTLTCYYVIETKLEVLNVSTLLQQQGLRVLESELFHYNISYLNMYTVVYGKRNKVTQCNGKKSTFSHRFHYLYNGVECIVVKENY